MKVYSGENIRNVAMVGHGHAGKTTLVSAMLYTAGATQRLGRVDDGSATTDHDEEDSRGEAGQYERFAEHENLPLTAVRVDDG